MGIFMLDIEDLYIDHGYQQLVWKDDAIENTLRLQLFLPFIAVKNLYLSKEFAPGVAAALGERITKVLPSLQNIFAEEPEPSGPFQKSIGQFVSRDRSPITVSPFLIGMATEVD